MFVVYVSVFDSLYIRSLIVYFSTIMDIKQINRQKNQETGQYFFPWFRIPFHMYKPYQNPYAEIGNG